ncbi:MAG: patatin-like phospholipase family protein [Anaerolineales bacterium]|nr:patatin-like phospholipase family protein [Anaerolineales bacterium]
MSRYQILSLDGGGIRGVLSAVLLARLAQAEPKLLGAVDLYAGTSTGAVLALGLAAGLPAQQLVALYREHGRDVFADTAIDNIRDVGNLIGAQYSATNFKRLLIQTFGDKRLRDLPVRVLVASFDLDNDAYDPSAFRTWKPKFFHNFPGEDSDGAERIVDVALRTTAAPTYFPVYQGFVDGGVVANNPAMCAIAQALSTATLRARPGGNAGATRRVRLEDIALLSIGTGRAPQYLTEQSADWGLSQWARPVIDIMINGGVDVVNYQAAHLLGDRYLRLNPSLDTNVALDAVEAVPQMVALAERLDLTPALTWLRREFLR